MAITPLPDAPLPTDSTAVFNSKAFEFVAALDPFVTEANALAVDVNEGAASAAADATSAASAALAATGAANFKGEWSTLTGALAIPASVSYSNKIWILTASVSNVAAEVPGVSTKWLSLNNFVDIAVSGVLSLSGSGVQITSSGTGAWKLPVGTTGERPTGAAGLIRQNSTTGNPEWWDAVSLSWLNFSQNSGYNINYLVVAGGGGGGEAGGGAGGLLPATASLTVGTAYTITVGAGGAGSATITTTNGTSGSTSSLGSIVTAAGGGGGGQTGAVGSNGGSGGGGGYQANYAGGSGTSGQGYAGGAGSNASNTSAGGGGGAGAVGGTATGSAAGNGGAGVANTISGTSVNYGGGGGGGGDSRGVTNGTGGTGGGGAGAYTTAGVAGTANRGGGGGGGGYNAPNWSTGGAGGSGIVIISYLGSQRGTGGTVTSSGGYTIHTFTSSGTFTA
jgi:hypothetical protein